MALNQAGRIGGFLLAFGVLAVAFVRERSKEFEEDIAAMKSALREVAMAEAAYHLDSGAYTTALSSRSRSTYSPQVTVLSASDTSWSAAVTHPEVRQSCRIAFAVRRGATLQEVIAARTAAINAIVCE